MFEINDDDLIEVELTAIEKMSDIKLYRELDKARRNIEEWQKREKDIQNEISRRYRDWKSMQEPEW